MLQVGVIDYFFFVLVEAVVFLVVFLLLDDVPVDLRVVELDLLDLLLDFFVDAFSSKTFSAVSSVMSSTVRPSGREALTFPCFT